MLTRESVPAVLSDLTVTTAAEAALPVQVCAEHLALLGAQRDLAHAAGPRNGADPLLAGMLALHPTSGGNGLAPGQPLDCALRWQPPHRRQPALPGSEAIIQALSGLMGVHGRDRLMPQRLGLEVASVAAGIVATQGVLAALIARSRGQS